MNKSQTLLEHPTPGTAFTPPGAIILCRLDNPYHPYATWWQNHQDGGRYMGHYFEDLEDARHDYERRCERGY